MRVFVISVLLVMGFPLIMTEVVDSFSKCSNFFLKEEPPEIEGILEKSSSQDKDRYKLICQKYEEKYRFATLYDTRQRIPVFSAYKFTGIYEKKPNNPWMMEPQLEPLDGTMSEPAVNQAADRDYWNQNKNENVNRGHLFPNGHAADKINAESTFTLTNTVPQKITFNKGTWRAMEQKVRAFMNTNCCDENNGNKVLAYVLTGAVPSNTRLKERVNIPSHMWTTFCCFNTKTNAWVSQAHWAPNIDERNPTPISTKTLEELEEFLVIKYKQSSLFNDICYSV